MPSTLMMRVSTGEAGIFCYGADHAPGLGVREAKVAKMENGPASAPHRLGEPTHKGRCA